ncbi:MAG: phytanoyl-CoA dioxygenase family protein, partial [Spirochaetaceae bacterium]|nr:phytanoyl-CoA dioxygenase family protein [Spirochaetaceae bacterium]
MTRRDELIENGYYVERAVLGAPDIETCKNRLREVARHVDYYRDKIRLIVDVQDESYRDHPDPLRRFDWINEISFRDPVLWRYAAAHPRLIALAMEVLGPDIYPLNGGGFFMKPPRHGGEVPWHQDASPFDGAGGIPVPVLFDFWLGLDAARIDNGCMELIPGSHLLGRLEHEDTGKIHAEVDPFRHGFSPRDIVRIETDPGDVIVWHQDMIHRSPPNRSDRPRIGKASVYMSGTDEAAVRRMNNPKGTMGGNRPPICLDG